MIRKQPRREGTFAILIGTDGRLILQLRDVLPYMSDPGKLGFFGGQREDGESFLDCVVPRQLISRYLSGDEYFAMKRSAGQHVVGTVTSNQLATLGGR